MDKSRNYQRITMIFAGVQVGLLLFGSKATGSSRMTVDLLIIICAISASIFAFLWFREVKRAQKNQPSSTSTDNQS